MASEQLAYRIVDVFSDRPLAGNGLCVVSGVPSDESLMQKIAREMNLSETTFVTLTADHAYDVRIFTPSEELPFAGHPSVGSAWTLGPGTWTQRSAGATVTIEVDGNGATMSQPDPTFTEVYPEDAATAWGLAAGAAPNAFVADVGGTRHLLVATAAPIESLHPDNNRLLAAARAVRAAGVGVMRKIDSTTIHVRLVAPSETASFEDPGTGSAAGPVGVLARRLWGVDADLLVRQGDEIGRPCRIHVHAEDGNVRVGGAVAPFAGGTFTLP